jgi:hypothetical protein
MYERIGVFCYMCGLLGNMIKVVQNFELENDDGTKEWEKTLHHIFRRIGTAPTNIYLHDPIPCR